MRGRCRKSATTPNGCGSRASGSCCRTSAVSPAPWKSCWNRRRTESSGLPRSGSTIVRFSRFRRFFSGFSAKPDDIIPTEGRDMRQLASAFLLLISFGSLADAQRLVFTMRTHPTCPVWITSTSQSKDYGFQTLTFASDSDKVIASVNLSVVLVNGEQEEVVDGNRVY